MRRPNGDDSKSDDSASEINSSDELSVDDELLSYCWNHERDSSAITNKTTGVTTPTNDQDVGAGELWVIRAGVRHRWPVKQAP
ncbi:hypothetical protein PI124_g19306 [Phytophthora idaei]|nr:hypothetical protein PI125_g18271 [Phytophthora idaei]KAG3132122.1 hypothetical protein PI126_g19772 [Phytophthora idaei]KAG3235666.1 hypothetical protein PI124_g19306 [Phytophthora idaei]